MAEPLKLVLLGSTASEVKELLEAQAQHFQNASLQEGRVTGCSVFRFSSQLDLGEKGSPSFSLYGASMESGYRGIYALLMHNADGVMGLIPADLARVKEGQSVLVSLLQGLEERRAESNELPLLLQYQWTASAISPAPEELDQALGVNPSAVSCIFTRAGAPEQTSGIEALLTKILATD